MKEFMFFIRKNSDSKETLSTDKFQQFLKGCEIYINDLKKQGKLISAQPIDRDGTIVSGKKGEWKNTPFNESKEIIGGYYHILADDLEEAIEIAKANPEFEFNSDTRIEVRPIKMKEESTGFIYPNE
jgi:hypothetical protein